MQQASNYPQKPGYPKHEEVHPFFTVGDTIDGSMMCGGCCCGFWTTPFISLGLLCCACSGKPKNVSMSYAAGTGIGIICLGLIAWAWFALTSTALDILKQAINSGADEVTINGRTRTLTPDEKIQFEQLAVKMIGISAGVATVLSVIGIVALIFGCLGLKKLVGQPRNTGQNAV